MTNHLASLLITDIDFHPTLFSADPRVTCKTKSQRARILRIAWKVSTETVQPA